MQSGYSSDTLQTRMPFWYSIRFQVQIQYGYALDTDAILLRIQITTSDTVHIRSRRGCHSVTHSDLKFRYNSDTLQTRMPFWYSFRFNSPIQFRYALDTDAILILIQIQLSDTVHIHSGHGSHSATYSVSSSDTLQTRLPFWYSFRFQIQI